VANGEDGEQSTVRDQQAARVVRQPGDDRLDQAVTGGCDRGAVHDAEDRADRQQQHRW